MRRDHIILVLLMLTSFVVGCAAIKSASDSIPRQHEEDVINMPDCLECHEADEAVGNRPFSTFTHNASFMSRHGKLVGEWQSICESCHKPKFCADCHGVKEEIVPARKLGNRPDRNSPHRGDYLSKHKIEGRLEQAKCFKCHGRRNNRTCKRCHNP